MDLNKYINPGMGLCKKAFEQLENIIKSFIGREYNILEFGSGISTEFLVDAKNFYNLDINIDSFDNSDYYSSKKSRFITKFNDSKFNSLFR